jgi:hypothetical protein
MTINYEQLAPLRNWHEYTYGIISDAAECLGWKITVTAFDCDRGDITIEGVFAYRKGALANIKAEWPKDRELHDIARRWHELQRRAFYQI